MTADFFENLSAIVIIVSQPFMPPDYLIFHQNCLNAKWLLLVVFGGLLLGKLFRFVVLPKGNKDNEKKKRR